MSDRLLDARERKSERDAERRCELVARLELPRAMLRPDGSRAAGSRRRAVDAVFHALPVVAIAGYSRPMVKVSDYLELLEQSTYRDDRVRG